MKAGTFEVAYGTVCGADHLGDYGVPAGANNQDAVLVREAGDSLIAVVCDGCSDRTDSGVGAALLARFFASAVTQLLPRFSPGKGDEIAEALQQEIVRRMNEVSVLCSPQGTGSKQAITQAADELFLCTLVGAVITPSATMIFAAGDGVWGVNSLHVETLGPFPGNEPPYLGYLIRGNAPATPKLIPVYDAPTREVKRLLIGSDGCSEIPPEEITRLASGDATFNNPETLNRALRKLNSQTVSFEGRSETLGFRVVPMWSERKLQDDATLVVIRKMIPPPAPQPARARPKAVRVPPRAASLPAEDPPVRPSRSPSWLKGLFGDNSSPSKESE